MSRTIAMINKYFGGQVQKPDSDHFPEDADFRKTAEKAIADYLSDFANFRIQNGIIAVWNLVNRSNKYIDETMPWVLAKDESKREALASVLYNLFESLRLIALMLSPVMPESAEKIISELGLEMTDFSALEFGITVESKVQEKVKPLFQRLDLEAEMEYHAGKENEEKEEMKPEITIDDFNKLDLRVGEILAAERIKGADKLLLLKVKVAGEARTIVAGIAEAYAPEELVGKKVAVLANLKPVKIRGHLSQGMLLAAEGDGKPAEVLEVFKHDSDSRIH